jgi:hypothetical protein
MNIRENFRYIIGILAIMFGTFLTFGGYAMYTDGEKGLAQVLGLVFFAGLLPILAGSWFIYTAMKSSKQRKYADSEKKILKLAMQSNGRVTVAQVTTFTNLSITDADNKLKELQEKGIFILKISEEGEIIYQLNVSMDSSASKLIDV